MRFRNLFLLLTAFLLLGIACKPKNTAKEKEEKNMLKEKVVSDTTDTATQLVTETIKAHGGELYDKAHYAFTFRDKRYTFKNNRGRYTYSVKSKKDGKAIQDQLTDGKLTRTIDEVETQLSNKDIAKYSEALNSVIYFATLPHKLGDFAVNKTHEGVTTINGKTYEILGITFQQEGGGKDFDDKFHYWINKENKTIDYLAYSYSTNEGGVRFRAAYNPRTVTGIRFQDYINYRAPIGTPLKDLPALYEAGSLEELSRIVTEDIVSLKEE